MEESSNSSPAGSSIPSSGSSASSHSPTSARTFTPPARSHTSPPISTNSICTFVPETQTSIVPAAPGCSASIVTSPLRATCSPAYVRATENFPPCTRERMLRTMGIRSSAAPVSMGGSAISGAAGSMCASSAIPSDWIDASMYVQETLPSLSTKPKERGTEISPRERAAQTVTSSPSCATVPSASMPSSIGIRLSAVRSASAPSKPKRSDSAAFARNSPYCTKASPACRSMSSCSSPNAR